MKVYITRGGLDSGPRAGGWLVDKVGLARKLDSKSWIGQKVGFTKLGWPKGWIRKVGFKKLGWPQSWVGKSSFSTGFIRFCDMAKCHVVYSEKPNAFLIILEAILRFGLQNDQNSSGFIRV